MNKHKTWVGFTLIEMLITVLILGILMSIAVNSFKQYLLKARRVEATSALMDLAMAQEKYFAQHLTYSSDISGQSGLNYQSQMTENGYYKLSVKITTFAIDGNDSFEMIASAYSTQQQDKSCQRFSINQLSQREAVDHKKAKNSECWR